MLSAKRRRRAATVPGAGQDGGSRGAEARWSRAARTPKLPVFPTGQVVVALPGVKPRRVGAVWIGLPPLCCTRIGTHACLLFAEGSP
jgi:hypothetical protein